MLMNEHSHADSAEVETIQKVVNPSLEIRNRVSRFLLHLHHSLGHRFHHSPMAILDAVQHVAEPSNTEDIHSSQFYFQAPYQAPH